MVFFLFFLAVFILFAQIVMHEKEKRTGVEYWKCIVSRNKNNIADVMKVSFEKEKIRKSSEVRKKEREQ